MNTKIQKYSIGYLVFLCGAFYAYVPADQWGKAMEQIADSPRARVYSIAHKVSL